MDIFGFDIFLFGNVRANLKMTISIASTTSKETREAHPIIEKKKYYMAYKFLNWNEIFKKKMSVWERSKENEKELQAIIENWFHNNTQII